MIKCYRGPDITQSTLLTIVYSLTVLQHTSGYSLPPLSHHTCSVVTHLSYQCNTLAGISVGTFPLIKTNCQ